MNLRLPPPLRHLVKRLLPLVAETPAYIVGGTLRDLLLGRPIKDLDLVLPVPPSLLGPRIAQGLQGKYVPLAPNMGRVVIPYQGHNAQIDLHHLTTTLEEDLLHRDFTIDAMAVPLALAWRKDDILDPTGGLLDLAHRKVRLVSKGAFQEDPIRLLRGIRLATELDFHLDDATAQAIARHHHLLTQTAPERQRDELVRILATDRAGQALKLMDELGLLATLLPELGPARGFPQPPKHYWDVLGHLLATVSFLDSILAPHVPMEHESLRQMLWDTLGPPADGLRAYLDEEMGPDVPRRALIKLGGLLHDVAKPHTSTVDDKGRRRFLGHEKRGAEVAKQIMSRLCFSRRQSDFVAIMVEAHLRPMHMSQQGLPTARAIFRFFRGCGEAAQAVLLLSLADHLATVGPQVDLHHWRRHIELVRYIILEGQREELASPPKLITGHDVMEALGIPQGPLVGHILRVVQEAQAVGEVRTREEALALARRLAAAQLSAPSGRT